MGKVRLTADSRPGARPQPPRAAPPGGACAPAAAVRALSRLPPRVPSSACGHCPWSPLPPVPPAASRVACPVLLGVLKYFRELFLNR